MRSGTRWLLGFTFGLTGMAASAQSNTLPHYRWVNAQGVTQLSDSLSSDALVRGYDVVNSRGVVMAHVPRALNAAERAAQQKSDEAAALKAKQAADQKTEDKRLLAAYPTEKEVMTLHSEVLTNLDGQIHSTQLNLKSQRAALDDLLTRAGDFDLAKKTVPKFLADKIREQQTIVTSQQNTLARQQAERARTVATQETELVHYRALKNMAASQAAPNTP